jgi:hypothetical protein
MPSPTPKHPGRCRIPLPVYGPATRPSPSTLACRLVRCSCCQRPAPTGKAPRCMDQEGKYQALARSVCGAMFQLHSAAASNSPFERDRSQAALAPAPQLRRSTTSATSASGMNTRTPIRCASGLAGCQRRAARIGGSPLTPKSCWPQCPPQPNTKFVHSLLPLLSESTYQPIPHRVASAARRTECRPGTPSTPAIRCPTPGTRTARRSRLASKAVRCLGNVQVAASAKIQFPRSAFYSAHQQKVWGRTRRPTGPPVIASRFLHRLTRRPAGRPLERVGGDGHAATSM